MGCGTIRAASERKHGIVGMMPYIGIHQGSACLFEDFGFRCPTDLFAMAAFPSGLSRWSNLHFGFESLRRGVRVFLHNFRRGGSEYLGASLLAPPSALSASRSRRSWWFFIAVVIVILATYLSLSRARSVLCRLLQKTKHYRKATLSPSHPWPTA